MVQVAILGLMLGCRQPADVPSGVFDVEELQGAVELSEGAAAAFAGVPVAVTLRTALGADARDGLFAVALVDGEEVAEAPWEGAELQPLNLPAPQLGDTVVVAITNRDRSQAEHVLSMSARSGPVAAVEPVDVRTWREAVLGPLGGVSHTFVGIGTAEQIELFPAAHDDPLDGAVGTSDLVILRLLDDDAVATPYVPVTLSVDNPGAILVRGPHDPDPVPLLRTRADRAGFVAFFVDYVGAGASAITVAGLGDTMGLGQVFACHDPVASAVISGVRATGREGGGNINPGLQEGGTILVFGETYCFGADVTGTLPDGAHITWCVDGEPLLDDQGDPVTGPEVCLEMPADPDPGDDGDDEHYCLTAKIQTADGEEMESEESLDFDVREKKTLPICVHEFGPNGADNTPAEWQDEIARVNEVFEGTGVCLALAPADLVQHGGSDKEVRITQTPETLAEDPKRTLSGSLPQCLEDDPSLGGSNDKITLYYGAQAIFRPGVVGAALGADEILDDADIEACYDIDGAYANTIALGTSLVPATDNALPHEIGHILGLGHRTESGALMRRTSGAEGTLNADEAATVYQEACDVLAGE